MIPKQASDPILAPYTWDSLTPWQWRQKPDNTFASVKEGAKNVNGERKPFQTKKKKEMCHAPNKARGVAT